MSIKYINMVWNCDEITDRGELCVLLALADWSDDEGNSYPSIPQLAAKSRFTDRGVMKVLARLKGRFVEWKENTGGRNIRNKYSLITEALNPEPRSGFRSHKKAGKTAPKTPNPVQGLLNKKSEPGSGFQNAKPRTGVHINPEPGSGAINHHINHHIKEGGDPLLQSFNPDGKSEENKPEKFAAAHLHFLSEKEKVYVASILDALRDFPPDFLPQAFIALLKGQHRGTTPTSSLLELRKKHGHVKMMAALVIAGNEGNGRGSSLKFLAGILGRWNVAKAQPGKSTPTSQNQNQTWQPARLDDMSFLDEPIQTPAR